MLSGSKLQMSAVCGVIFKFARAALFGLGRCPYPGSRLTNRGTLRPAAAATSTAMQLPRVRSALGLRADEDLEHG